MLIRLMKGAGQTARYIFAQRILPLRLGKLRTLARLDQHILLAHIEMAQEQLQERH